MIRLPRIIDRQRVKDFRETINVPDGRLALFYGAGVSLHFVDVDPADFDHYVSSRSADHTLHFFDEETAKEVYANWCPDDEIIFSEKGAKNS